MTPRSAADRETVGMNLATHRTRTATPCEGRYYGQAVYTVVHDLPSCRPYPAEDAKKGTTASRLNCMREMGACFQGEVHNLLEQKSRLQPALGM